MNCPRCATGTLVELDRDGIQIDRCSRCRGIWLDRGELDKLIAESMARHDGDGDDDDDDSPRALLGGNRRRGDDERGGRGFWANLFD